MKKSSMILISLLALMGLLSLAPTLALAHHLEWSAPTTNEDGSPATDIAGYNVYKQSLGTGEWVKLNSTLVVTVNYTPTVHPVKRDKYRVTAVDSMGIESNPSNEAQYLVKLSNPFGLGILP